jgi:chromosome segregation ATPase
MTVGLSSMLLLAGCAASNERELAAYESDLARARAGIDEAQSAGAYEHGSAELERARSKLAAAENALEDDEPARAVRLAKESELDAKLATAIAQNQEMQDAVVEIERSIETLEQEIARNAEPSPTDRPAVLQSGRNL